MGYVKEQQRKHGPKVKVARRPRRARGIYVKKICCVCAKTNKRLDSSALGVLIRGSPADGLIFDPSGLLPGAG